MDIHSGARTCPASRALMVRRIQDGWTVTNAAKAAGVSRTTVYKWLRRYEDEGDDGLRDRSSRPHHSPRATPEARRKMVIELRRSRMPGRSIARRLRMPRSTVSRILRQVKLSRTRDLDPPEKVVRYEREHPGELIHLDIKRLARFDKPGHRVTKDRTGQSGHKGIGWEYVHVAIDDASRMAYAEVLENEQAPTCTAFFVRAVEFFRDHGVHTERVMTDNGAGYRSHLFRSTSLEMGIRHIRTQPYRPQTNGKAERFIQTLLREWAYVRPYRNSSYRKRALRPYLRRYNHKRGHGSLNDKPPISRL